MNSEQLTAYNLGYLEGKKSREEEIKGLKETATEESLKNKRFKEKLKVLSKAINDIIREKK